MKSVQEIAREIVTREGGFVDDPDDPGGATKHGVTIATLQRLGMDLDRDGDVDVADVRALTEAQAADIFLKHYYQKPRINLLPEPLQATVFDMYVNAGSAAVRILQKLLVRMGFDFSVDGGIGPQTGKTAHEALKTAPGHLVDAYGIERRNHYYAIGDRRVASRKFARRRDGGKGGWITRAEEFISPKYHLSDREHAARISSWG